MRVTTFVKLLLRPRHTLAWEWNVLSDTVPSYPNIVTPASYRSFRAQCWTDSLWPSTLLSWIQLSSNEWMNRGITCRWRLCYQRFLFANAPTLSSILCFVHLAQIHGIDQFLLCLPCCRTANERERQLPERCSLLIGRQIVIGSTGLKGKEVTWKDVGVCPPCLV